MALNKELDTAMNEIMKANDGMNRNLIRYKEDIRLRKMILVEKNAS